MQKSPRMTFWDSAETLGSGLLWAGAVSYSLYQLHIFTEKEVNGINELTAYSYGDFVQGWFGRHRDISDLEWSSWTVLTMRLLPWLFLNLVVSIIFRSSASRRKFTPLAYSVISLLAIAQVLSFFSALLFLAMTFTFYIASFPKQPVILFLLAWMWRRYLPTSLLAVNEDEVYIIEVAGSWLVLRSLACSFEVCRGEKSSLGLLMGYSLYLPTMFCGPLLPISHFAKCCESPAPKMNAEWVLTVVKSFTRCLIWFMVTTLAMHYLYASAILLRPYLLLEMTLWELAGLGIAMGHFFHLKYVVFYGLPSCWAQAEGFATPPAPCCVSTVYLYSVMWRRFDPGLYAFLLRYIYIPVASASKLRHLSKPVASMSCFFFVFVWHGEYDYVLYWVVLNFTAVAIEGYAKAVCRLPTVQAKFDQYLSLRNQRRLHCLCAAPLHYFSMLSNYFFIGNMDVGKIYFHRAYRESMKNNLIILVILFGAAQINLFIETRSKRKSKET